MDAFCGIDVACALGKPLPIAVVVTIDRRLCALPLVELVPPPPRGMGNAGALDSEQCMRFAEETVAYLHAIERAFDVRIRRIAIDAPYAPSHRRRRVSEQLLSDAGISCIPTPSIAGIDELRRRARAHVERGGATSRIPAANQLWMLVGFALFERLSAVAPCIETYPNAIVQAIAPGCAHKSTRDGFERQLAAFAREAAWDSGELTVAAFGSRHDRLDATMSAWIASLPECDRVAYGSEETDTIWSVRPRQIGAR